MKATGIVRRIDDLGRVVIPKEIRKNLNIHEGDPLEIFTDPNLRVVCFKPYVPYYEPWRLLEDAAEIMSDEEDFHEFAAEVYAASVPTGTEITQSVGMPSNALLFATVGGVVGSKRMRPRL